VAGLRRKRDADRAGRTRAERVRSPRHQAHLQLPLSPPHLS
jgi:hypothetical protein